MDIAFNNDVITFSPILQRKKTANKISVYNWTTWYSLHCSPLRSDKMRAASFNITERWRKSGWRITAKTISADLLNPQMSSSSWDLSVQSRQNQETTETSAPFRQESVPLSIERGTRVFLYKLRAAVWHADTTAQLNWYNWHADTTQSRGLSLCLNNPF